ncbi:autotransporter assembly complex protein TamA [Rhizobium sp. LjRoot30]|uniref:autotransporter assembly complex protein TamA n=1 Tax=Rhizobium sp. LjRoot30 TaxID=3342320 RepID=UPI003ECEE83A
MPKTLCKPKESIAYRRAGTVVTVAASALLCPVFATEAHAFKLFGITLWGEEEQTVDVIDPVNYSVTLNAEAADDDLKAALENASHLIQDKDKPVSGDLGLVIKARDDRDRLIATLYEKSRYGGVVTVLVDGTDIDQLPPTPVFDPSRPVPVTVEIKPGPAFTLGDIRFEGDALGRNPADYGLVQGGDASSLIILKAGDRIVEDLKNEGRPLAKLDNRSVVADHETAQVDVVLTASGGPVAPVGNVGVNGQKSVDPEFIRTYSRINEGRPYNPENLKKAGERLRQLGVFSSVTVREGDTLSPDGTIPVNITVAEGKHRYFGVGAQYSTIDGFGLQGYWGHRNLFGRAESLRLEAAVSRLGEATGYQDLDYSAGIIFSKPGFILPSATLNASIKAKTEHPDSYLANTVTAATGIAYELSDQDTASAGVELSYSDTEDAFGNNEYLTFSLPLEYARDARDNKLDPTEGYRATLAAKPSYEIFGSTFFSSFEGSVSGYQSLGAEDRVVFAGKASLGTLVGAGNLEDIPATRRFYAGGGGSVRGYAYQEISPYDAKGDATGGRSYAVVSAEARVKITDSIGLVPFVDAGTVSEKMFPDFSDVRIGAGLGIRYATPFGPIRLDVAVPLNRYEGGSSYGIYAGIGQAF